MFVIIIIIFILIILLHCLFNKNRIIESFTEDDDGTKYKPYPQTIENLPILIKANSGNIKFLKEQVDKLNKEIKIVTDLSGQIQGNKHMIQTMIKHTVSPHLNTGLTTTKTKKL